MRKSGPKISAVNFSTTTWSIQQEQSNSTSLSNVIYPTLQKGEVRRRADTYLSGGYGSLLNFELKEGKDAGLIVSVNVMFGLPTETEEDRNYTRRFIDLLKPTTADTFVFLGQPGSDYYKMLDATKTYEFKERNGLFYLHSRALRQAERRAYQRIVKD